MTICNENRFCSEWGGSVPDLVFRKNFDEMSRGVPFIEQWFVMIKLIYGNKYAISPGQCLAAQASTTEILDRITCTILVLTRAVA
jgi:hypothetical protein